MALNAENTLEAFVDRLSRNSEIMNILKLPTIKDSDTNTVKKKCQKVNFK